MSSTFTYTEATTFTVTHARHLAAKVATDLKRMQRFYGAPSDARIEELQAELTELLKLGYVERVLYGFKRDGQWIEPTLRYTAHELFGASGDDDPGKVRPGADISGATFSSYLVRTSAWWQLSADARLRIESELPVQRTGADEPTVAGGHYFEDDKTYSSGSRALNRSSVRGL